MEYINQIQKLTKRPVSGCASGCTHWRVYPYNLFLLFLSHTHTHIHTQTYTRARAHTLCVSRARVRVMTVK